MSDSARSLDFEELKYADCEYERRIDTHKVDLQVRLCKESGAGDRYLLPIELKADSGPSGEKQFPEMSVHLSKHEGYLQGLVFCLGSGSVQDHNWGQFRMLGPDGLLQRWMPYYEQGFEYFKNWMQALAIEIARRKLAPEVHRLNKEQRECFWQYGFRSYKHLMYYVYAGFRDYLKVTDCLAKWSIYDGGYNAVMNLVEGPESWREIPGLPGVKWYFEFNDDRFCLRLEQKSDDAEAVIAWARKCREKLQAAETLDRIRLKRNSTWRKGWPLLGDWDVDFSDYQKLNERIDGIIRTYGASGIMGGI